MGTMPVSECNRRRTNELPPTRSAGTPRATLTVLLVTGLADEATTPTPYSFAAYESEPLIIKFANCASQEMPEPWRKHPLRHRGKQILKRILSAQVCRSGVQGVSVMKAAVTSRTLVQDSEEGWPTRGDQRH